MTLSFFTGVILVGSEFGIVKRFGLDGFIVDFFGLFVGVSVMVFPDFGPTSAHFWLKRFELQAFSRVFEVQYQWKTWVWI